MGRIATVCLLTIIAASVVSARGTLPAVAPGEVVDTEQSIFTSGGLLEINNSFGNVDIIGWDRPEIEVVVSKSACKPVDPSDLDQAVSALDRISITTEQQSSDHVVIRTAFPPRSVMRPLGGKSNVHLVYTIHVPRQTRLMVKHSVGIVRVHEITANMLLSNRYGDIEVSLPENQRYAIDAKARVGGVSSEWCPISQASTTDDGAVPHQLQLRVGTGAITVRKTPVLPEALVD